VLINRLSNNQKYRFRKNPMDPAVSRKLPLLIIFNPLIEYILDLETLPTARGKKLLVSGWWGLVRHPNYLGDILTQISFGLIAGMFENNVVMSGI
jgi:steroid 5-alpha reductase family enzyme